MSIEKGYRFPREMRMVTYADFDKVAGIGDNTQPHQEIKDNFVRRDEFSKTTILREYIHNSVDKKSRAVVIVSSAVRCELIKKYSGLDGMVITDADPMVINKFNEGNKDILYVPFHCLSVLRFKMKNVRNVLIFDIHDFGKSFALIQDLVGRTASSFAAFVDSFNRKEFEIFIRLSKVYLETLYFRKRPEIEFASDIVYDLKDVNYGDVPEKKCNLAPIPEEESKVEPISEEESKVEPIPDSWKLAKEKRSLYLYFVITSEEFFRRANEGIEEFPGSFSSEVGFSILTASPISTNENLDFPASATEIGTFKFLHVPQSNVLSIPTDDRYDDLSKFQTKFFDQIDLEKVSTRGQKFMVAPTIYKFVSVEAGGRRIAGYEIDWKMILEVAEIETCSDHPDPLFVRYRNMGKMFIPILDQWNHLAMAGQQKLHSDSIGA